MAEGKRSFVLYADYIELFDELSDEHAGRLIKHILQYVNDKNPETKDPIVKVSFIPIKQQLKRDLQKYESICTKNKENALKRWHATASEPMPVDAKNADNETDIDNEIDIDINKYKKTLLSELKNNSDFEPKEYLDITLAFWELFKHNLEEKDISTSRIEKANGKWIDSIRLLIENDKYTMDDLREIFKFLQVNEFWKTNILSTSKLREQFQKLLSNSRKNEQQGTTKTGCTPEELAEVIGKHFASD